MLIKNVVGVFAGALVLVFLYRLNPHSTECGFLCHGVTIAIVAALWELNNQWFLDCNPWKKCLRNSVEFGTSVFIPFVLSGIATITHMY